MEPRIDSFISFAAAAIPADGGGSGTFGGLLLYFSIAIGISFLCSLLEAGFLSTPNSYVESRAQSGDRAARLMQKHKANVEDGITAILTLNTFAHTFGAAGAGAEAVGIFGSEFAAVITIVLTAMILVFSEIIPKTVGAVYWKQLFPFTTYMIQVLVVGLYPLVWAFKAVTRILKRGEGGSETVSRSEVEMMARLATLGGDLKENESRVIRNLLHMDEIQVSDIMTPRTVLLALEESVTVGEVVRQKQLLHYSRIPVYREHIDDIAGFVLRNDVLARAADDQYEMAIGDLVLPIHPVPETLSAAKALDEFMARQQHIFLVIDEYGGTAGVLTLEDAVESLLGREITDESDLVVDMREFAQQRFMRQRALYNLPRIPVPGKTSTLNGAGANIINANAHNGANGANGSGASASSPASTPPSSHAEGA